MPSARYYREQAKALLSWARISNNQAYIDRLRARAAEELEQAERAREAVADLNLLLLDFNAQRLTAAQQQAPRIRRPEPNMQDLLVLLGSADEIAATDTAQFARKLADVITGACSSPKIAASNDGL